jgi:Icc-related predicted phosphoesterase
LANNNPINKQREKEKRRINNILSTGITKEGTIKTLEKRKMNNKHAPPKKSNLEREE